MSSSRAQPKFSDGSWMDVDGSGKLSWFSKNGAIIFSVDTSGNITGLVGITSTGALVVVGVTNTGATTLGTTGQFVVNASGLPTKSNGVTLAGQGFPLIVAAPATNVGAVAGITNFINFTPPAAAGVYRMSFFVNVTAWTTPASFNVVLAYKDEAGTARSYNAALANVATMLQSQAVTAVSLYLGTNFAFPIDNSATAITLSTSGTFTGSPVYDFGAVLERLI